MIQFQCPGCNSEIETPDEYAGRSARCPTCNRRIRVPREAAALTAQPADAELQAEPPSSSGVFRLEGRTYAVRPRLEGMLIASAVVIALSIVVFVAIGLMAPVYTPWFLAGLIGGAFALFGALLVLPAYYNIRRSRGRKTGERLAFVDIAVAAVLVVTFLSLALVSRALADNTSCGERLKLVYAALRAYAADNGGLMPPSPETLVEQGHLAASKLTCPLVHGARQGTATYDGRSYLTDRSGRSVIDFRSDVPRFPGDLMILMGGGLHRIRNKATGEDDRGYYVLTLDGSVAYVRQEEANGWLTEQRKVVDRVLAERQIDREARTGAAEGSESGESPAEP